MTQAVTCGCGATFGPGDAFCQSCGTRRASMAESATVPPVPLAAPVPPVPSAPPVSQAPPVPPVPSARRAAPPTAPPTGNGWQRLGAPFFTHATPRPPEPMSNSTRYLCAAAYLDPSFSNRVIRELVASHRAVIPSRGIDLVPIVRHCLKARKMQLMRDVLLCVLLLLGVLLLRAPLVALLVITFLFGFMPGAHWERKSVGGRALAGVGAVVLIVILVVIFLFLLLASDAGSSLPLGLSLNAGTAFFGLAYAAVIAATLGYYCYVRNRTLGEWLSPGAQAPPFERSAPRVENRLAEINAAQHGNLTLYSGEDPFLGNGYPPFQWRKADTRIGADSRAWSICVELHREGAPRRNIFDPEPPSRVPIDPVELHGVLRKRLLELNDPALPPNERISALTVEDNVVGEGRFRWDSPLVDAKKLIPFSQVRPEAIPALIKNPQARLRYYQRVSINDKGQMVLAEDQPVIGPVDQEVVVSAFIYVAVEGHMFYLQFVPTSLAPIGDAYHVIDHLPKISSGKFVLKTVMDAARTSFRDFLGSPLGVYQTLRLMRKESKSFNQELDHSKDYVYADIGANISVRQFGSMLTPRTYIQQLDVSKYTQIVERLVLDTVLDYLVAKGVDVAAYRAAAQAIYNSGIIVGGNVRNSDLSVQQHK
jgi:hypothetical protein